MFIVDSYNLGPLDGLSVLSEGSTVRQSVIESTHRQTSESVG